MPHNELTPPSTEPVLEMVRGELSSNRRWFYRLLLLVISVVLALLLSLWTTEPGPLPFRTHVAFGAATCINLGWVSVLVWILTRQNCPTVLARLATAWTATIACCVFLVVLVTITLVRGDLQAALGVLLTGFVFLCVAISSLRGAYSLREKLRRKLAQLEEASRTSGPPAG
jgi:O-antigen/teichoic acid export membrane protein